MAGTFELITGHKKREAVGDEQWGHDFECGPCFGKVANGAVYSTAAELNRSGLQHAATWGNSVFVHSGIIGRISRASVGAQFDLSRLRAGKCNPGEAYSVHANVLLEMLNNGEIRWHGVEDRQRLMS